MDFFCKYRWNFDESDPEKDKSIFMVCSSVCEECFHQKCVKIKREVFLYEKVHQSWKCHLCWTDFLVYICLTSTRNVIYLLSFRLDLSWLGFEKKPLLFCFFTS